MNRTRYKLFSTRFTEDNMDITKDTIIGEIVESCPEAMPKFQEIGMHCMGCALASGETVEEACMAHGVDPDEFIQELTDYLSSVS
jgi:hybrid cluster-associated redox disulfide protein